jgi:hypothetical protein
MTNSQQTALAIHEIKILKYIKLKIEDCHIKKYYTTAIYMIKLSISTLLLYFP